MEKFGWLSLMGVITLFVIAVVVILNGSTAADCTATSTWASEAVEHCVEGE